MNPVKKLLTALITALTACTVISLLVTAGNKKFYSHIHGKFAVLFSDTAQYDILFAGSSRVHSNINPAVIDSITGLNSFNAGVEGANIYEVKTIVEGYLASHPAPRILVLGIDLFSFDITKKLFNYSFYLPYAGNKKIDSVLRRNGHYASLYKFIPLLQLTGVDDFYKTSAVNGLAGKTELNPGQTEYKGYLSLDGEGLQGKTLYLREETMQVDTSAIRCLNDIIAVCKTNNTRVIFLYAPEYKALWQKKVGNAAAVFSLITEIARQNNIAFLRGDSLALCSNPGLFHNVRHLNRQGAAVYSEILAAAIIK